jgi:ElaA protein
MAYPAPDIPEIRWILKPFDRLTPEELYALLKLRSRVFVLEQECLYLDQDDKDQQAFHLLGLQGAGLVAYARLFGPGDYYKEAAIGRIVTAPEIRGKGAGRALLSKALEIATRLYGEGAIRIGAQQYLKKFYEGLGFAVDGDPYLEDGIPHIEMVYRPANHGLSG